MIDIYWLISVISRSTCFFVQAEDGIRDLVRSRGLGDVYKRQVELSVVVGWEQVELERYIAIFEKLADRAAHVEHSLSLIHI